jgi:hypothetical protein
VAAPASRITIRCAASAWYAACKIRGITVQGYEQSGGSSCVTISPRIETRTRGTKIIKTEFFASRTNAPDLGQRAGFPARCIAERSR